MALGEVRIDDFFDLLDHQFRWKAGEDSVVLGLLISDAEQGELGLAHAHPSCGRLVNECEHLVA